MFQRPVFLGLIASLAAWIWMFFLVHYNYGGNWTALFLIGPRTPVPPWVASERLYIFPDNSGYDGQSFHLMAHDPWMRRSTPAYLEIAPFRYARILVPAMAWILAAGRDRWIDPGYFAVILGFVFLGVYWTALYAVRASLHPAWGLGFLLSPATLTSIDRMTCDIALAALCVGFVLATGKRARYQAILVLACALLTRETAWILFASYELFLLSRRRFGEALLVPVAAVPLLAWQVYVAARAGEFAAPPRLLGWVPLAGFFHRLTHSVSYDLAPWIARIALAFDYVALAGMALAVVLAAALFVESVPRRSAVHRPATAHCFAIFGFALAVVFLRGQGEWADAFAFGRIFAPFLLLLAMYNLNSRSPWQVWLGIAPTLLVDSRIALNFARHAQQAILAVFGIA